MYFWKNRVKAKLWVESSWNVMAHGDAREGKWRGKLANGVGSQYPLSQNMVYPALLPLMSTPRLPVVDWTDALADLNGLFRFAERRNLVSARVPSHFKRSLLLVVRFNIRITHSIDRDSSTTNLEPYAETCWVSKGIKLSLSMKAGRKNRGITPLILILG